MNQPEAMMSLYADATKFAMQMHQTVGKKHDYYITLAQLEAMIRPFVEVTLSNPTK